MSTPKTAASPEVRSVVPLAPFGPAGPLYDDAHRALGEALESVLDAGDRALHQPAEIVPRLGALGLLAHLDPRPRGSLDVRTLTVARDALAYVSPVADAIYAVQGLAIHALAGSRAHEELIAALVAGRRVGAFALTEPEAGSDVAAMRTRARAESGGYVLDGEKVFISNVGIADAFVVFARLEGDDAASAGTPGPVCAFAVPQGARGLETERIFMSVDHPLGRLRMDGCTVGKDALVGAVGEGMRRALGTLDVFRTSVGGAALGMARRALDETVRHVKSRRQFGKALAELDLVRGSIADMTMELEAAQLVVAATAHAKDTDRSLSRSASGRRVATAKVTATETAQRVIDRAVQLHGGLGVTSAVVEALYREIRPLRIYEGATDVLKLVIAADVLA